jgi:hypothetical protein
MRGSDVRSGSLFSCVDLEARVRRDHPLRLIREIGNAALASLNGDLEALPASAGSTVDPAGAAAAGDAAAGVLRHPLGASADGADGVRSSVPLVRGPGSRRSDVGPLELLAVGVRQRVQRRVCMRSNGLDRST